MKSVVILYPVFFLLVLLLSKNKKSHRLYCIIISVYFLAGLASVYICSNFWSYMSLPFSIGAVSFHLIALFLLLRPLKEFDERRSIELAEPNRVVDTFTWIVVFLVLLYLIDGVRYVNFNSIIADVQGLRQELVEQDTSRSLLGYIAFISKQLSVAPIALMFYYMINKPERKALIIILFVCSLAFPIVELRFAAREYLVKYVFVVFCLYFCTKHKIPPHWKKTVYKGGVVIVSIIAFVFLLISFLRFEDVGDTNTKDSLIAYFGQGFAYFSEVFIHHPDGLFPEHGTMCFPFFAGEGRSVYNMSSQVVSSIHLNVFRTTIGSWLADCGIYLTAVITIIYSIVFRIIGKIRYQNVFTLIYMGWVYDFTFSSLFFFHSIVTGTSILVYLFVVIMDFISRNK